MEAHTIEGSPDGQEWRVCEKKYDNDARIIWFPMSSLSLSFLIQVLSLDRANENLSKSE